MKKTLKICLVAVLAVCAMVVCAMTASAEVTSDTQGNVTTYTVDADHYYTVDNDAHKITGRSYGPGAGSNEFSWTLYLEGYSNTALVGRMEVTGPSSWSSIRLDEGGNYAVSAEIYFHFRDNFGANVKSMYLNGTNWGEVVCSQEGNGSVFSGFANLEEIYVKGRDSGKSQTWTQYWTGKGMFEGCTSLKTVYWGGNDKIEGLIDLGFVTEFKNAYLCQTMFKGCESIEKVKMPSTINTIYADMFSGCTNLGEVVWSDSITTIEKGAFANSPYAYITCEDGGKAKVEGLLDTAGVEIPVNPAEIPGPKDETVTVDADNYYTVHTDGTVSGVSGSSASNAYTWIFYTSKYEGTDEKPGTLIFKIREGYTNAAENSYRVIETTQIYREFKEAYASEIKYVRFDDRFYRVHTNGYNNDQLLQNLTNLQQVLFKYSLAEISAYGGNYDGGIRGFFEGCSSLTTFGLISDYEIGTVDLSLLKSYVNQGSDGPTCRTMSETLKGCSSVTKVILGAANTTLYANMFKGCTALEEITLTVEPTEAESGFLSDASDAVILCDTAIESAVKALLAAKDITNEVNPSPVAAGSMTFDYFRIRVESYNGLRSFFKFNENFSGTARENNGYTLTEYGTIYVAESNYSKFEKTLNGENSFLSLEDGAFVTPDSVRVIKTAVYMAGAANNGYVGKCDPSDPSAVSFVVTLTNIPDAHMASGVVSMGYEIWEKDGQYVAIYTEYSNPDYAVTSLYEVTVGMLEKDIIKVTMGNNPVWNCVNNCKTEAITGLDEGITGLILEDPLNEDKYYALYATDSETAVDLTDYKIPTDYADKISGYIIGANITDKTSALPAGYEDWQEHMDTQLAKVPVGGQSFMFITDTHWDDNNGQSTELLKYVNKKLGINTVVFGGDLYSKSDVSEEDALAKVNDYWNDELYKAFDSDALYVRGNHDSNDLGVLAGNPIPIKDTAMFAATVANIDGAVIDTERADGFAKKVGEYIDAYKANPPKAATKPTNTDDPNYAADLKAYQAWEEYQILTKYDKEVYVEEARAFMKMHYYKDYEDQQIRYISLDTAGKTWTQVNLFGNKAGYNAALALQLEWLVEVLGSTPAEYNVVVAAHSLGDETSGTAGADVYDANGMSRYVWQILSNFRHHKTSQIWAWIPDSLILRDYLETNSDNCLVFNADFTDRTSDNRVVVLGGHWHSDQAYYIGKSEGTWTQEVADTNGGATTLDDAILYVRTGSDALNASDCDARKDTNYQRFDIVTFTGNGEVVFTRIGALEDRRFQY